MIFIYFLAFIECTISDSIFSRQADISPKVTYIKTGIKATKIITITFNITLIKLIIFSLVAMVHKYHFLCDTLN